ncbi:lamina-associated polypeptide 2, isoforms beta/gamma-like isoform X2 [Corythoichthys intestinalis]|uniref:lamina-associated polypeptide 2, isoforms beta/gamma-like isoform X2 n=1 Tax=Corythoichthys intestinalis TaxID=161448 RepID=UPI0025A5A4EA|nr:lamina-associated polypeptide 2, isoforms beta/gamma-like isoform X2 [Corythoichthys intestinalis]
MPVLRKHPAVNSWRTNELAEPDYIPQRHVYQRTIAALSSEEDEHHGTAEKPGDGEKHYYSMLTDDDLMAKLLEYGIKAGPIVGSTRSLYERKLRRLQAKRGAPKVVETIVISSDEYNDWSVGDDESEAKRGDEEIDVQKRNEEEHVPFRNGHVYQQCFILSSRMRSVACTSSDANLSHNPSLEKCAKSMQSEGVFTIPNDKSEPLSFKKHSEFESKVSHKSVQDSKCSSENFSITEMVEKMEKKMSPIAESESMENDVPESSTQSNGLAMDEVDMRHSQWFAPERSFSNWETKMHTSELTKDDWVHNIQAARTVINVTCRRPIKGAAGRPIQFNNKKSTFHPTSMGRREMDQQMVPVYIQFVMFLIVAFLLFAIVESEPLTPLLAVVYNAMKGFINGTKVS